MYIILGDDKADAMRDKYTVLELDTIKFTADNTTAVAYAVVENIPIADMPKADSWRELHHNLMLNYRKQDWNFCSQAVEHLTGAWNRELDSFYSEMLTRINHFKENDPGPDWDPALVK